jgi:trans-2,3-dihydro-3-hydroxyanthranilate isomerase
MFIRHVMFDLNNSPIDLEGLRAYLRDESVDAFATVPGLRLKFWIADDQANTWGAIYVWESRRACEAAGQLPSRAAELIGSGPTEVREYDVEASVEGAYSSPELARQGRAFE